MLPLSRVSVPPLAPFFLGRGTRSSSSSSDDSPTAARISTPLVRPRDGRRSAGPYSEGAPPPPASSCRAGAAWSAFCAATCRRT
eukprot:scaffold11692_cov97-Isochrysis_galbana.AAC.3